MYFVVCTRAASFWFVEFGLRGISGRKVLVGVGFSKVAMWLGECILGIFGGGKVVDVEVGLDEVGVGCC